MTGDDLKQPDQRRKVLNDQTRNLNPHKEAVVAMNLWSVEYAEHGGGSMGFYDTLDDGRKRRCRALVDRIEAATKRATRLK